LGLGIALVIIGIQEEAESYGEIESKFFGPSRIHENLCLQQEPKMRWRKFWVCVATLTLGLFFPLSVIRPQSAPSSKRRFQTAATMGSDAYCSVAIMVPAEKQAVLGLGQDLIKQLAHSSFCFEDRVTMVHGSR
jgi:hypothetical protein